MAIARKIAYNVIFNAITKILSTILALVGIGFITRYLGKEGFGDYSTVLAFFAFFGSVADLGLYAITARDISRADADEKKILGNAFSLRLISSVAVFLVTPILVFFLPYSQDVKIGILIAAASFVFSSTYMVLNGVFQKNLAMDKVATAEVLGKIIQIAIIIFAVRNDLGFITIILSILAAMIFNFTVVLLLVQKYIPLKLQFDFVYWKKFLKESAPLGFSAIVIFVYFKIDTILLSVLKTNTEVGIYNAAYKVIENLSFFPAMIIGLMFPMFSRHIFSDKKQFAHLANETIKVFFIIIVPLIIGTLFLSEGIINLIGGSAFSQAANTLRILIFALAFIFFGGLFNNILIASNNQKKMLWMLIGCALFNVSANLIFIPAYSYTASAIISTLTEFLVAFTGLILTIKYTGFKPSLKYLLRILFSGFAMAIFLFIFKAYSFLTLVLGSSIFYIVLLWITKTITIKELRSIVSSK
ncbi:MAG: Membrane protein involved in the export of O-antigen and teichoic acid [Candidatus Moranbacteria bacterium GW2011_GWC2_37_73]|nr:MAG: Polysaccharide biosynthesis protein [Parcubacteria group bacterium GW2011_GWC1_36_108]KKQ00236.1 MAG: Membrane protein involved in the export of O-antigen and teichoic acid [Candidatus Moranbacteria bacterium GW2011_GWD1_36_198]KKQ01360.1 MAG: Membrane protein involved in the export of O-antigen and teichoic acid [Candidatus Moranbacteria bacterium GW2011_GWD2_36_198]KKQ39257.1 MAG: Membrane protein involved in the export of O-antigen and teichoic acid [Candidatus Moranbacteria bacterium